jgi:ADP-ribosylglycohydrolase
VDLGQVIIKNKSLSRVLSLTQSDRRFIDYVIQCAEQYAGTTHTNARSQSGAHWIASPDPP